MGTISIRPANIGDAKNILKIYAYYTENTAVSFEYTAPTLEEFRGRMERIKARYPYFVAEEDGKILGYCYAGPFVRRKAYDWSCELTIYLSPDQKGRGIGKKLYTALEEALIKMGITNMYACIGVPEKEDEYLNNNSMNFHAHMGFTEVGRFRNCGYKFGRWYHMIWMEKIIGEYQENQPPVINYHNS